MNPRQNSSSRRGQALVELAAAMIVIVAILAAMLTLARLGREQLDALHEARAEAAGAALAPTYAMRLPAPRYLCDWDEGPDGARHSRDDAAQAGDPYAVVRHIAAHAHPEELDFRLPDNPLTALATREPMIFEYRLVSGRARPRTVELLPVARHLLYDAESVTIEAEAWLTWMPGLD
jgi:hypothetical protein